MTDVKCKAGILPTDMRHEKKEVRLHLIYYNGN